MLGQLELVNWHGVKSVLTALHIVPDSGKDYGTPKTRLSDITVDDTPRKQDD
jgi:hypothetical protein